MAFRLMRYSMAVKCSAISSMINVGRYRWSSRCCFITVAVVLTPGPCAGWTNLPTPLLHGNFILQRSRWWMSLSCQTTRLCSTADSALLELIQKHIRQRDLMGLIDQLVILLVTECANDSQITALLNYILLTGDEARFNEFISELTRRMPQHRERIMTIAERIHNDGWLLGIYGKRERRRGTTPRRLLLQNGADPEWIQRYTWFRQSKCRH